MSDDGIVTLAKMRKVFGQNARIDRGPTERRLREMLKKDVKGYVAKMDAWEAEEGASSKRELERVAEVDRLREECEELRAKVAALEPVAGGPDRGTDAAMDALRAFLRSHGKKA